MRLKKFAVLEGTRTEKVEKEVRLTKFAVMEGTRTDIVEKEVRVEIEEVCRHGRDRKG